jgi:DNA (cytosine-5)-methyltransferase 1
MEHLTKPELLKKCKEFGIKKYSSKNKLELIDLLEAHIEKTQEIDGSQDSQGSQSSASGSQDILDTSESKTLKFIDLFCGIGGFHQALKRINNTECVLACDIDKDCRQTYFVNYNMMPVEDVKKINENTLVDFDIICAGFPCQAFSNGGKKKCFEDERGLLFDEIMRIAKAKKPKFMFLENVKHILKVSNGKVIEYIKKRIAEVGYHLQLFQISPHNYGIPQQRERVYFVCVRNDIYNGSNGSDGVDIVLDKPKKKIKFEDYLDKKEDIDDKYFVKGDILNVLECWDEMIKQMAVGEKISPTIMINNAFQNYTDADGIALFKSFPDWKRDYITKNRPLIQKYPLFKEWYEKHSELLKKREIYGKLEWQTGPIKENDSIFNHFIQVRQSGIRVKKGHYFPTLVAISQIPIYGKERRYITPRECARLQSFPDTFILADDKKSYKQLGNSVNVDNVYTVISSTLKKYGYMI